MAHPTPANGSAAIQKDIPASATKPKEQIPAATVSSASASPSPAPEDLYDYQKCTVMIVIQLRPQREADGPRPVLLSVQNGTANKEDLPMFRLLPAEEALGGPLPPAITTLLQALEVDLPVRKQRNAERKARPPAIQTNTVQKTKEQQKKPATRTTSAPPPVPATINPVPKDGIVFSGLFDNL